MSAELLDDLELLGDPAHQPLLPPQGSRPDLAARAEQLVRDVAFLLATIGGGLLTGVLLAIGAAMTLAAAVATGVAIVYLVPLLLLCTVALWVSSRVLRGFAPRVHRRLPRRPLRRLLRRVVVVVGRAPAAALVWWLLALRTVARRARPRVAARLGRPIPLAYRPLPAGTAGTAGTAARLRVLGTDPATWRDLGYVVLAPLAAMVAGWLVGVAWIGGAVLALSNLIGGSLVAPSTWFAVSAGITIVLLAPLVTHLLATGVAAVSVLLLSPGEAARMRSEADEQRLRRQFAVDAAERERRRIERDLHDGAQQRLVALGITLGLAREALPADPPVGAALVDEAHEQAKLALSELRDLARGIHPAILGDRGLDAALSDLVRRTPIPTSILVAVPTRPATAVESAAYFVVSEALTNIARHSGATRITIRITQPDGHLVVEVTDDGVGGADPALGTGLTGLADRIDALDGRLTIDSPLGGPTTITAEIPCGS